MKKDANKFFTIKPLQIFVLIVKPLFLIKKISHLGELREKFIQ